MSNVEKNNRNYKIVVDSCCDLPHNLREDKHFSIIPLTLMVDEYTIVDDSDFNQLDFLKKVRESKNCPKSACPSPERFMQEMECENTDIYVVTLSSELSGSYNSAVLGKNLYEEEGGTNNVHIFDSKSASSGEVLAAIKIKELADSGMMYDDIVEKTENYLSGMKTYFVLETLDTLRKNGRLTNLQAFVASALHIKPVMSADNGVIIKLSQARGIERALKKMTDTIIEKTTNCKDLYLTISHCNNEERALLVKKELESHMNLKGIFIVPTAGVSSMYANEGGIIVAV